MGPTVDKGGKPTMQPQLIAAASEQARCDVVQAEFRKEAGVKHPLRREPPPLPKALVPTDDRLQLRLAEELEYARRMLDAMGDALSSDSLIVTRHGRSLQSVDIVGQMIGHIVNVIRSSDPEGAVERIGMAELKARLTRREAL